jgi:glycosyltransferase involved in cell wall biosynthesis
MIITCAHFLIEHVRSTLLDRYQDSQLIVAVPNAVDTARFHRGNKLAAKLQVGAPSQIPLVLMAANLAPHKGQETVLRAAAILKEKEVPVQFWFAGTERGEKKDYTARLHALAQNLGIADQVQFLGQRQDVPELLQAADVFVLPSTAEGLPLSILEAQASGTPVLAAPTAGIPEVVIDGKTGFLVPADDAAGYAHHLLSLFHNHDLYSQIADNAYAMVVRECNWTTYCERIWETYQTLIRT